MLRTNVVTIHDEEYEVKEIAVGKILPMLPLLQGDPEQQQEAQHSILKQCIFQKGEVLGEGIMELGLASYIRLAEEVMKINGLSDAGEEGKG